MHKKYPGRLDHTPQTKMNGPNDQNEEMASEKGDQAKNGANPTMNLGKLGYSKCETGIMCQEKQEQTNILVRIIQL